MVFPARAGMILLRPLRISSPSSIPRESGDDPALFGEGLHPDAYSPRERG